MPPDDDGDGGARSQPGCRAVYSSPLDARAALAQARRGPRNAATPAARGM